MMSDFTPIPRVPSEPPEFLEETLSHALPLIDVPDGSGVMVQGSIAEGLGDPYSDIDFLLVAPGDQPLPIMPTNIRKEERRIEIWFRSSRTVIEHAQRLHRIDPTSEEALRSLSSHDFEKYQRFAHGAPIRNKHLLEDLQRQHDAQRFAVLASAWWRMHAADAVWRARVALRLGRTEDAVGLARRGVETAAKAWVAERGDTYVSERFLPAQLLRVPGGTAVHERLEPLLRPGRLERPATYVQACAEEASALGVSLRDDSDKSVLARTPAEVTRWDIGPTACVLRGSKDLFALSAEAALLWPTLAEGACLADVIEANPELDRSAALAALGDLHRHGLLELTPRSGTGGWRLGHGLPRSAAGGCRVTPHGPRFDQPPPGHVHWIPIAPGRFASAGANLLWSGVLVENSREDFVGAAERDRWPQAARALRRMVEQACNLVLSGFGVEPLPESTHLVAALREVANLPDGFAEAARALLYSPAREEAEVRGLYADVEAFLERIPEELQDPNVRRSHQSIASWLQVMALGFGWIRLAVHLDAPVPLEEARDLLTHAHGGKQARVLDQSAGEGRGDADRRLEVKPAD